jgi:hypothetical protein
LVFAWRRPGRAAVLERQTLFDNLSEKLSGILDRLTRRGALTEADVDAALREVRRALIEARTSRSTSRARSSTGCASRRSAPRW